MVVDIGDRLREARERIGMTQLELAEKVGVHVATATLWENRRNRRPVATKHIHKLAEVLGMRVSELLGEETRELSPLPIPKPEPTLTTRTNAEYQLLRLFRQMSEELKLWQLAQFMQCVSSGQSGQPMGHEMSIDSAARASTVLGFGR
jgi:transcriptional regulator with XRE-family HTH domain